MKAKIINSIAGFEPIFRRSNTHVLLAIYTTTNPATKPKAEDTK
jgi:hypothetical protein